ncbi:hypothetical protein ACFQFC_07875 [Amorphoplanes digitatis]|uniref:Uncharacterized protein n=1 Tax=Actinoplanes digitatis TaxID=1868 RepID=A0A7W7MRD4_9ACTN|nr:hypothetical protein [Actinoplanes digitatis]MBB4764121.1 hypothetical protein [Actinoplanes digitatis]BFE73468.1 hypothetical protein GCM10020092_067690 [Actinoplanes digitatis]GID97399.1 hypothetical protein Adi01nite_68110 [Actinoplanes digitatis]
MHGEILNLLDCHLSELQALRRELSGRHAALPGERRRVAAATASAAERYARTLSSMLTDVDGQLPAAP